MDRRTPRHLDLIPAPGGSAAQTFAGPAQAGRTGAGLEGAMETYEGWIKRVDALLVAKYGIGVDDGVDWTSAAAHEDGCTPEEAVEIWKEAQV